MIKIWVDDIREMPADYTIWLRSTMDAIHYIRKLNPKTEFLLDLDHDAGNYYKFGGDYYKILDWCEAHRYTPFVRFHSMNPAGVTKMRLIANRNNWKIIRQGNI